MTAFSPKPLLNEAVTARILGVQVRSLQQARYDGRGDLATLPYCKIGQKVRYRPEVLDRWIAERERVRGRERVRQRRDVPAAA